MKHTQKTDIAIIGTGFAGLAMAIRLKQAGLDSFTLYEQAEGIGGTWRDNSYPGAACDVPSHLYSFSFEPNPQWTRHFAPQAEILDYLEHCTDKYGLRPHIRFNSPVRSARFDEDASEWVLTIGEGEEVRAHLVISGCGSLSRPSLPAIPGLADFQGKLFHSARWDHDHALEGKTVAIIGTGASAIQIVPRIAPRVKQLHLFQRTPPWVLPKEDRLLGPRERTLYEALPAMQWLHRQAIYWKYEGRLPLFVSKIPLVRFFERRALRWLERSIPDPGLRAKLTPNYAMGCKRVLLSDDYYPALLRPNVELVTEPIQTVTRDGLLTVDGKARPVDTLIFATGFQAAEAVSPFPIQGRGGLRLEEAWRTSAEAYLGTTVAGVPNFFFLVGPNTLLGHNSMVFMIESQVQYVLDCIQTLRRGGFETLEVRESAQARFNQRLLERLGRTVWSTGGCASWYKTRTGKNTTLWPGSTVEFRWRTRQLEPGDYHLEK
ncbi:NAD(P)/FAD-dependent oxidoreductase [Cystobacter fuscus]|uniref:flavin-containing monooxygenase n=1 Tax=Cystobacter fuscus TaxID=43 RepID=UPI002B2828F8|nr:NAD(P)/FAD-dependent oxidoreductase [Cystobacter fuscus]